MQCSIQITTSACLDSPEHNSVEAACRVEFDVNPEQAPGSPGGWKDQVSAALRACLEAVDAEIVSRRDGVADGIVPQQVLNRDSTDRVSRRARRRHRGRRGRRGRRDRSDVSAAAHDGPATDLQRRTIDAICRRLGLDPKVAAENHHFRLNELKVRHASMLIRQLSRLNRQHRLREYLRCSTPAMARPDRPPARKAG